LVVFFGAFGSGKTEVAINYAFRLQAMGERTVLVDLDTVTPFFRSREARDRLERGGVTVVAPADDLSWIDAPSLPPELPRALHQPHDAVVLDVGGDVAGARTLGSLARLFDGREYRALYVVNTRRPLTRGPEAIECSLRDIEAAARLRASGLVANTHLGARTSAAVVRRGVEITREAASRLGIRLQMVAVERRLLSAPELESFAEDVLPLELYMRPPWERPVRPPETPERP